MINAASEARVDRLIMISTMGADAPDSGRETCSITFAPNRPLIATFAQADLATPIVCSGSLTDDSGTRHINAAAELKSDRSVPRNDVAAVLLQVLDAANTKDKQFELLEGDIPLQQAVAAR
jgi:hypothetical protein